MSRTGVTYPSSFPVIRYFVSYLTTPLELEILYSIYFPTELFCDSALSFKMSVWIEP